MTNNTDSKMNSLPKFSEHDVSISRDEEFFQNIDALIHDAEAIRLSFMKRHRSRSYVTTTLSLISITIGATGFGWFLLMDPDIIRAAGCIILALACPALLHFWSAAILKGYKDGYKKEFLPRLAKELGGFKFHPSRGISSKIISKTGLVPKHDIYNAEDCFMGRYKGVKVLFSEARLLHSKKYLPPIFDGIFVLLEIPNAVIEGHTILTADEVMYQNWRNTRWKKLKNVPVDREDPHHDRFHVLSDNPEAASLLIGQRLIKELSEAADVFDEAELSAAFFREKFIFLMIPYSGDMFEASSIHIPVATRQHALSFKREIEQILEIIDVFDLYEPTETLPNGNGASETKQTDN